MTAIGAVPEHWARATLGSVFEIQQGKAVSAKSRSVGTVKPFLRTANVLWGRLNLETLDSMGFTEREAQRLTLRPLDLLVCEGGDIGRTAIWRGELEECYYQNHLHRLRALRPDTVPEFFMYWMQAAFQVLGLYRGEGNRTTIPNLSRSRLASFVVPVPPPAEQRAIAHILSTTQRAIDATEVVIEAARQMKRSLMRHLFTYGPVSLADAERVSLKETEIGSLPEPWAVVELSQVCEQTQYGLSRRGEAEGAYPILRMNNLNGGHVRPLALQYVELDEATFAKFRLRTGDILFNRTNSFELVGKTALFDLPGDYVFASYLIRVAVDQRRMYPPFLNYYMNMATTQRRLKGLASRAVSQSNINATKLRGFTVPLPPLRDQENAVSVLGIVDDKIEAEEKRRVVLDQLFRTLLQQLMTGEVPPVGVLMHD